MISARHALLRQAQQYFHMHLLGVVKWDDVVVDKPIPIPPVRGNREQGKFKDIVTVSFNGFKMELIGPFEREDCPLGRVKVSYGNVSAHGPLDAVTWARIADFIKEQKQQGADHGTESTTTTTGAGDDWGR
jgi:hypothetical protein